MKETRGPSIGVSGRHIGGLFLLLANVMIWPAVSAGQTQFDEPTQRVDYTNYPTPDQCVAGLDRLEDALKRRDTIYWDTVPPGRTWRRDPWPQPIVQMVTQCSAQWPAATASTDEFPWLFRLYLAAGHLADATLYFDRALAASKEKSDDVHTGVLITAASEFLRARPAHLGDADSLLRLLGTFAPGKRGGVGLVNLNLSLRLRASEMGDTSLAMRAAVRADAVWLELQDEEKKDLRYFYTQSDAIHNSRFIHHRTLIDSLRKNTAAYVNLVLAQAQNTVKGLARYPIGDTRPPLAADFWFPGKPSKALPVPGKNSIVWPVVGACAQGGITTWLMTCHETYALIRRIHQRFPDVEIILVSYIEGGFLAQAPPSPQQEADLKWRWLSETLRVPFTLAVLPGTFAGMPAPDRRMISTYWTLDMMNDYTSGENATRRNVDSDMDATHLGNFQILDPAGIVVWVGVNSVEGESQIYDILEVLQQRGR